MSRKYQALKAQKMAADVQVAASDDAEHTLQTLHAPPVLDRQRSSLQSRLPNFGGPASRIGRPGAVPISRTGWPTPAQTGRSE